MENKKLMTVLKDDVLKELQHTQIEILQEIVRICEKYHLRYFLIYGTLIGAVRHKGFIPWDDDLDIGMPRDDYKKFMQVAKAELKEDYFLQNIDTENNYWLTFAKVRKNHTIFEEPSVVDMPNTMHKGIFVDIFPFDYIKKNQGLLVHLQFILSKSIIETCYYKAGVFNCEDSLNYKTLDKVWNLFSLKQLNKIQEYIASFQNKNKAKYFADFNLELNYLKDMYPIEYLLPTKLAKFDGCEFMIPNNEDAYLRMIYGDYMVLPKEEDRVNHRTLRIVFDTRKEQ